MRAGKINLMLMIMLVLTGCAQPVRQVLPAFYHWQTTWAPSAEETRLLQRLQAGRIYAKFFDLDTGAGNDAVAPVAALRLEAPLPYEIVPTVFITNRAMARLTGSAPDSIAQKTIDKIFRQLEQLGLPFPREVQFDCDWTTSTQERYFRFLTSAKRLLAQRNIALSATIRLHQVKYPERTGIPPVDRGMLMCYNVGDLKAWETANSILDPAIVGQYLSARTLTAYPLPLDLALPLYHWGVLYRDGRMIRLINNLQAADLAGNPKMEMLATDRFLVRESTFFQGYYLYAGDQIRTERITPELLVQTSRLLNNYFPKKDFYLSFYHLDSTVIASWPYEELEKILDIF